MRGFASSVVMAGFIASTASAGGGQYKALLTLDSESGASQRGTFEVRLKSNATIELYTTFDLDDGLKFRWVEGQDQKSTADITLVLQGEHLYLKAMNLATIWVGNGNARGYGGCVAGAANQVPKPTYVAQEPITRFKVGTFICVKTNAGRYSEIEITKIGIDSHQPLFPTDNTSSISFDFLTWTPLR